MGSLVQRLAPSASGGAPESVMEVEWSRQSDDASVPPMGDLDAHFFESASPFAAEPEVRNPRLMAVRSAAAQRRRAHFARYVIGAVGVSLALCVAALVKASVSRAYEEGGGHTSAPAVQTMTTVTFMPAVQTMASATPPPAVQQVASADPTPPATMAAPPSEAPSPVASQPVGPVALPETPPVAPSDRVAPPAASGPEVSAAATAVAPPTAAAEGAHARDPAAAPALDPAATAKEALGARESARTELGRGRARDAIVAGERSVSLDPTDGEAWLILGAAYQQKGDMAEARRCYKACLAQGKRGPKSECGAMLR